MYPSRRANDSVHWFMSELTSRVVAQSGIPTDRHHLGKILLQSFKDDPDFVLQIDGATGESETNGSVLERSVRCAIALKNLGLQCGDVITLMAPNHIDLAIPFYAALYLGVIVSAIDRTLVVNELQGNFKLTRPKVVFCQSERARDVRLALNGLESNAFIVTFDKGDFCSFPELLEKHGDSRPTGIEEFKPTDFDPEETIGLLISTSGTTGLPKAAAATHKNLAITGPYPMRANDSVHWFMSELTSRVVAQSGIPTDRHHLGKILLQSFKDDPDFVLQIDGATGESETNGSVLERSVRCAIALKNLGLQCGDVITLMAPNHIDLAIPFYAALYLGVIVSAIDRTLVVNELQGNFKLTRPKVVFCQSERARDVRLALNGLESNAFIVTFDKGDFCSFPELLEKHGDSRPTGIEEFKPTDFDPEETIGLLISTSGTTGLPKAAAATHKNLAITGPHPMSRWTQFPTPFKMALVMSSMQWLTALVVFLTSPILRLTRLQSSRPLTHQHTYELINAYKPTYMIISPTFLTKLIKSEGHEQCDFSCYETIIATGSAVTADLIHEMKKLAPNTEILNGFGISEATSLAFQDDGTNFGSGTVGKPVGWLQYRLIDVQTQEDIREPNRNGELWLKGPGIIKHYYRNPEATAEAFTEDRWFKTGDLFYRDEQYNFFFVERIKLLLKYMNHQISPVELEITIRQHPGVLDVAVVGVPDPDGELPVACVVRRPGHDVSAAEIKDIVKDNLADSKQLRGGVIFLDAIPQTATTKMDRRKLKQIAMQKQAEH